MVNKFKLFLTIPVLFITLFISHTVFGTGFQGYVKEKDADIKSANPIPGAAITFIKEDFRFQKTVVSSHNGYYSVTLSPGRYSVRAAHKNYEDYCSYNSEFEAKFQPGLQNMDFYLKPPTVTTVFLVRHAEKVYDDSTPDQLIPLTEEGEKRARTLRSFLLKAGISGIYATEFKRTQDTVEPLASFLALPTNLYTKDNYTGVVNDVFLNNSGDVVLVAGHSDTVGSIIQTFSPSATVCNINVNDYDNLYMVTLKHLNGRIPLFISNVLNFQYGVQTDPNTDAMHENQMTSHLLVRNVPSGTVGEEIAQKLVHIAKKAGVTKLYADNSEESQLTVQYLSSDLGLPIEPLYDPSNISDLVDVLKDSNTNDVCLIAGELVSLEEIIDQLNDIPLAPLSKSYGDLFVLTRLTEYAYKVVNLRYYFFQRLAFKAPIKATGQPILGAVNVSRVFIGLNTQASTFPSPGPPPEYTVHTVLEGGLFEDYRKAGSNYEEWKMIVQVGEEADPNQEGFFPFLSWDPNDFYPPDPNQGRLSLYGEDAAGKRRLLVWDMHQINQYQTKEEDGFLLPTGKAWFANYYIVWSKEVSIEMHMPVGWSMISLPAIPASNLVSDLFPHAVVAYGYAKDTGYFRVERLDHGKGYWILFYEEHTYTITGQPIFEYTTTVYEDGWEMIGGCTFPARATADTCNIIVIYRYIPEIGYQRVFETENLIPGEGYWILLRDVVNQCELTVRSVPLVP